MTDEEVDEVMRAGRVEAIGILDALKAIVCHESMDAWLPLCHAKFYLEGRHPEQQASA